jgi:hypothetical protein
MNGGSAPIALILWKRASHLGERKKGGLGGTWKVHSYSPFLNNDYDFRTVFWGE